MSKTLKAKIERLESQQRSNELELKDVTVGSINGVPVSVKELTETLIKFSRNQTER